MIMADIEIEGRVVAVKGPGIVAALPYVKLGAVCAINVDAAAPLLARVVGFEEERVLLAPFDVMAGVAAGQRVTVLREGLALYESALQPNAVVDCFGLPLGCKNPNGKRRVLCNGSHWDIKRAPPNPLTRRLIKQQFFSGIDSIDTLLPLGEGQRVGLFAGAGAGKSTLMGIMASAADVDVVVVGLIGERGRELGEFLNDNLDAHARARTTVVVATSDESAARRYLAAETATAIAEYHRNSGKRVLLLIDSLTRVARALREMSLAAGEHPVRQGYTASVFSELPILLERSGNDDCGTMTALYTVLLNGDNDSDPLADEIKSLLDGHIVLHPSVAARGLRPAVDVTQSVSRVVGRVVPESELPLVASVHAGFSRFKRDRDVVTFGGQPDAQLARLLANEKKIMLELNQGSQAKTFVNRAQIIAQKRKVVAELI